MKISEAETRTNRYVSIQKLLVAVDLSRHSNATATYAAEIAKSCAASLTTVYIYEPVPLCDYTREATYSLIESQCEDSQKLLDERTKKIQKTGVVCDSVF
jgi:nucleotide-binding universal stress UspA family protein